MIDEKMSDLVSESVIKVTHINQIAHCHPNVLSLAQ